MVATSSPLRTCAASTLAKRYFRRSRRQGYWSPFASAMSLGSPVSRWQRGAAPVRFAVRICVCAQPASATRSAASP
eukprot:14120485-Alexandrium_andersonii.AAC.1